jgi:phosphoglycerol transferase MdoB-like AlkP superfamily enzyme
VNEKVIYMNKNLKNTLIIFLFMALSIAYYEMVFKMRVLMLNFDITLWRAVTFGVAYSLFILFILKFFRTKISMILFYIFNGIILFDFFNQEIYSSWFKGFFSLSVTSDVKEGLSFLNDYFESLEMSQILYFLPLILIIVAHKMKWFTFEIEYDRLKHPLIILLFAFLTFAYSVGTISQEIEAGIDEDIAYSDRDLYTNVYNSQTTVKKFGLLTYTYRDFMNLFIKDPLTDSEYEVLLADYLENRPEHETNTYTNLFTNKNFILIMAESLDTYAINEELTPTLWRLKNEYAYFDNYYSPLYYRSTADTEFMVQTSVYPDKNVTLSMESYIGNTFPYTLPKLFSAKGYNTYSFHDYTDYFYPRTQFHSETLGYDVYYGSEALGLLDNPPEGSIINNHIWQSDLEMMELAIPKFIDDDKFFVNMLTVSGHFRYTKNHEIGSLHEQEVLDYEERNGIDLPDTIFWYLAANIELDRALEYLINELEDANKMDDTVIMIFGDHYAYGVGDETIWEYDTIKEDYDEMDIHNVPMILVSNSYMLDEPVENYMSSIDIIPTVSNLFGLPLDYQAVFGTDALSTGEHIVRFSDMSFVSKDFRYESLSEQYIIVDEAVTPEYLLEINFRILNDYKYNLLLLHYDYFREEDEETIE